MAPEEIRARREGAGMSPEDLASALGLSVRTVYRWEQGQKVPRKGEIIALDVIFSEQAGSKSAPRATRKAIKR